MHPTTIITAAALVTASGAATAIAGTHSDDPSRLAPIHGHYAPDIDPSNFVRRVDNRWFPLRPGRRFVYKGVAENGRTRQKDVEVVTHRHKLIMGVRATVVRDTVSQHGHAVERTFDWYAQDRGGNVWYMGELSRERHHGRFVEAGDSWEAGVKGAQPGIIMPGHPRRGQRYRQEFFPGHALDQARVLGREGDVVRTVETAPKLDPGVRERKYYISGIGDVEERTVSGNREHITLVRMTP
jgi:hypothetical protein